MINSQCQNDNTYNEQTMTGGQIGQAWGGAYPPQDNGVCHHCGACRHCGNVPNRTFGPIWYWQPNVTTGTYTVTCGPTSLASMGSAGLGAASAQYQ